MILDPPFPCHSTRVEIRNGGSGRSSISLALRLRGFARVSRRNDSRKEAKSVQEESTLLTVNAHVHRETACAPCLHEP
jgi:hypothetical protein